MAEDAWAAGEAEPLDDGPRGLPPVDLESGVPVTVAFSVDTFLRNGLRALSEQPALALVPAGIVFLITMLSIGASTAFSVLQPPPEDPTAMAASQMISSGISLFFSLFQQVVTVGAWVALARYVATGRVELGLIFTSLLAVVRFLVYGVVVSLLLIPVVILLMAPGGGLLFLGFSEEMMPLGILGALLMLVATLPMLYISLGLSLGGYAAVLDGLWPFAAIQRSWQLASGARLTLFVLFVVIGLLSIVGFCTLGIGLIPVNAVVFGGTAASWLLVTRGEAIRQRGFFERNPISGYEG